MPSSEQFKTTGDILGELFGGKTVTQTKAGEMISIIEVLGNTLAFEIDGKGPLLMSLNNFIHFFRDQIKSNSQ